MARHRAAPPNGDVLIQATPGEFSGTQGQDIGNGTDVIQSGSIGEPAAMPGELVFTIKVDNLSTVLPGFRWAFYFNIAGRPAPSNGYYYVAMVSADGPTPVFNYGYKTVNAAGFGQYQVLGTLNAASNFTADGTITLVLDKSAFDLATGDQLTHLDAETRTSAPDDLTGTTSAGVGLTQESAGAAVPYTLVGNSTCASNAAPVPHLSANVTKGNAPLAVTLNGSSSTAAHGRERCVLPVQLWRWHVDVLADLADGSAHLLDAWHLHGKPAGGRQPGLGWRFSEHPDHHRRGPSREGHDAHANAGFNACGQFPKLHVERGHGRLVLLLVGGHDTGQKRHLYQLSDHRDLVERNQDPDAGQNGVRTLAVVYQRGLAV